MAAPGTDTNSSSYTSKFFIPEASQFGFTADFNFGFLPASIDVTGNSKKLIGINLSFYYLQKQLTTRDSLRSVFSTGMIQVKTGLEIIVVRNALSVYGN